MTESIFRDTGAFGRDSHHPQTLADWPGGREWAVPSRRPHRGAHSVSSFSPRRPRVGAGRAACVSSRTPGPLSSLPASDVRDCAGAAPLHRVLRPGRGSVQLRRLLLLSARVRRSDGLPASVCLFAGLLRHPCARPGLTQVYSPGALTSPCPSAGPLGPAQA